MILKGFIEEDMVNYYKPSMTLMMPNCNWKCGKDLCHNSPLALANEIAVDPEYIVKRYIANDIVEALVFSGLEPMDDFKDVLAMISAFREVSADTIVIYTGYNKEEILTQIEILQSKFSNIIVKYGRYKPSQTGYIDPLLGIYLVSTNQYAEKIS